MEASSKPAANNLSVNGERGAALITMLLVSLLILTAGGTLLLTTSMSAANTIDAAAEIQAYYAAEAGTQTVLNVLRGHVAPNPVFAPDPNGGVAPENQITFRKAVTISTSNISGDNAAPRLSRWMSYNTSYNPARVTLSPSYTPTNGMAFNASLSDPDNSAVVIFSTSGGFTNRSMATEHQFGSGNARATLTYVQQTTTTINTSGSSTLGRFSISNVGSSGYTFSTPEPFEITITQTTPWPTTYKISCTITGSITSATSFVVVNFPTLSNNLEGTLYTRASNPINTNGTTPIAVAITSPDPKRLVVNVTGFGPRNARRQMRMLLNRFAFELTAPSAITLRSADDNSQLTFSAGDSARYVYNGNDNAGGQNLSAFGVTGSVDYLYLSALSLPGSQVFGNPSGVNQLDISSLPEWLKTANAARAFVSELRITAQNQNRYFTTEAQPPDFGTPSDPVLTFVDGDTDLPPTGGAGLLVVTGTFTANGSADYKGMILVLGGGQVMRNGGGNGNSLGALLVARFNNTGNFLAPIFNSDGSGTATFQYDSSWVRRALASTGPRVMAIGEF